jgi:hypothetical protein
MPSSVAFPTGFKFPADTPAETEEPAVSGQPAAPAVFAFTFTSSLDKFLVNVDLELGQDASKEDATLFRAAQAAHAGQTISGDTLSAALRKIAALEAQVILRRAQTHLAKAKAASSRNPAMANSFLMEAKTSLDALEATQHMRDKVVPIRMATFAQNLHDYIEVGFAAELERAKQEAQYGQIRALPSPHPSAFDRPVTVDLSQELLSVLDQTVDDLQANLRQPETPDNKAMRTRTQGRCQAALCASIALRKANNEKLRCAGPQFRSF